MEKMYKGRVKRLKRSGVLWLALLLILMLQNIAFADPGSGSVTMGGWIYGETPANPVPYSDTNGIVGVEYEYKKSSASDSTYTSVKPKDVGTYTVKATFPANANYEQCTATNEFSITKRTLNIVADAKSREYGDVNPQLTFTYNNNVTGETPGFNSWISTSATATSNVGTYDIVQNGLTLADNGDFLADNYKINYTKSTLTINRKSIPTPVAIEGLIYDGTSQKGVMEGTGYTITGNTGTNAGTYNATVTPESNYQWNNGNNLTSARQVTWVIGKRTLNVFADTKYKEYQAANPALTYTYSNQASGQTPTFSGSLQTSATTNSSVGVYDITQGTLALNEPYASNYTISYNKGILSIGRKVAMIPSKVTGLIYNGTVQTGVPAGTGYTITNNTATNAGKYTAELTLLSDYEWNSTDNKYAPITIEWEIEKYDLSGTTITISQNPVTYTGNPLTPAITVKQGSLTLIEGEDYSVEYSNNINVTTSAKIKITTLEKNHKGSKEVTFTISKKTAYAPSKTDYEYDGIEHYGVPEGEGYTLSGALSATDAGTYHVTAILNSNYVWNDNTTAPKQYDWVISKAPLTGRPPKNTSKMLGEADPPIYPIINGLKNGEINGNTGTLAREAGELASYYLITGNGTYNIADNGTFKKSNYTYTYVSEEAYFRIISLSIESALVTLNPSSYTYDGNAKTPSVAVSLNGTTLRQGTDYTVRYISNTDAGNAIVYIDGKGDYVGMQEKTFPINQLDLSTVRNQVTITATPNSFPYDGTAKIPNVNVKWNNKNLVVDYDYEMSFSNNIEPGNNTAVITIQGKGNYKGTITQTYSITRVPISGTATLSVNRYEYNGYERTPAITKFVTDDGVELEAGRDYTYTYSNNVNAGIAEITFTGVNHYTGTTKTYFEIVKANPIITLRNKITVYNNTPVTIGEANIDKVFNYKNKGENSVREALNDLVYSYYSDVTLTTKLTGVPKEAGIYWVTATLPEENYTQGTSVFRNHNEATSNVVRLVIFGEPNAPIVQGNDGYNNVPNGGVVGKGIYINIFGSEASYSKEALVRYKYSLDNTIWTTYTKTLNYTGEGTYTLYAKAYLVDNPSVESSVVSYSFTIDKTPPALGEVTAPVHTDTVVIDVKVEGDEVIDAFITEDPNKVPDETDDWDYLGDNEDREKGNLIFELSQGDGEKTIYVWQRDEGGNVSGPVEKHITLDALKVGNYNINKTNFYFQVTDDYLHTSEITKDKLKLLVNGFDVNGSITEISEEVIEKGKKYTVTMENIETDGEFSFTVENMTVYDRAGNFISDDDAYVETNEITIDNTLPILRVAQEDGKAIIVVSDEHLKAITHNGTIISRINGRFESRLRAGKNIFKAIDEYGNDVETTIEYNSVKVHGSSLANEPELLDQMRAAYLNGSDEWEDAPVFTDSMYDYQMSEWANATTPDGSMWVWIPRFAYKKIYYTDSSYETEAPEGTVTDYYLYDTLFLYGRSNDYLDINGNLLALPDGYEVAEAFRMPEANYELRGFWMAKYEMSREDSVDGITWTPSTQLLGGGDAITTKAGAEDKNIRVVSKPNRTSWSGISVDKVFRNSLYMYPNDNSHMMKNAEYEATLILGQTEFGNYRGIQLDTTIPTGVDVNTTTTGNITGVYDMIGGRWEYTSTYIADASLSTYSASLVESSDLGIKKIITTSEVDDIELHDKEKALINNTNLSNPYLTSYVVYRGLDNTGNDYLVRSVPVGGTPDERVGYRVILSNDRSISEDDMYAETNSLASAYNLTLHPNYVELTPYTIKVKNTNTYTLPNELYFARSGYRLVGFSEDSNTLPTGTYYATEETININGDMTLYAVWEKEPCKVDFVLSEGETGGPNGPLYYNEGTNINPSTEWAKPVKTGYKFEGWGQEKNGTTILVSANSTSFTIDSSLTLYPVWRVKLTYDITYDMNGGEKGTAPEAEVKYEDNPYTITSGAPTRWNGVFKGWARNQTATNPEFVAGDTYNTNASLNLFAVWQINQITITFDPNGGSLGTISPTITEDQGTPINIPSTLPTKTGYTFTGWMYTQNATVSQVAAGSSVTLSASVTLYAQWEEKTAILVYDANGHGTAPAAVTMKYTEATNASSDMTARGYRFDGWNTASDGSGTPYAAGAQVKAANVVPENTTLYAQWSDYLAPLTYDANGHGTAPASVTMNYPDEFRAAAAISATGYTFDSWNTKADGTGTKYNANEVVKAANTIPKETTLYAQWIEATAKLVYLANGHGTAPQTVSMKYSEAAYAAGAISATGFTFNGWNTAADGSGITYAAGAQVKAADVMPVNITLYAQWIDYQATLSYDANGHGTAPAPVTMRYSETVNAADALTAIGYTFVKWNTKADGSGTSYVAGAQVKAEYTAPDDMTLYAIWTDVTATLSYNANGHGTAPANTTMKYSEAANAAGAISANGYTFNGWNTAANGSGTQYAAGAQVKAANVIPENTTLYAQWTTVTYTVSYTLNGGSVETANPTSYTVETASFTLNNPTKVGYTFAGWTGSNGENAQATITVAQGSTGNRNYIANWTPIKYSILYELNYGSVATANPVEYTIETNTFTLNSPTRAGYTFTGWTGSNGETPQTSVSITQGSIGNKNYVANWTPETYTISYNLNGGSVATANPTSYTVETEAFTLNNPTKTGYVFAGWTGSNGENAQTSIAIAQGSTGNRNYVANWTEKTALLTYNANGHGVAPTSTTMRYTVAANAAGAITDVSHTFTGWNTAADGSGTPYAAGAQVKAANVEPEEITLYAQWSTVSYSISYTLNGGSEVTPNPTTYTTETNTFTLNNPTKTGYTFTGWTGSNGETEQVLVTIEKGSIGDKSYVAHWTPEVYAITYVLNGGNVETANPTTYTIESSAITLNNPTRVGYIFAGWTGSNGETPQTTVSIASGSIGAKNYEANWTEKTATLSYNANGHGTAPESVTISYTESVNAASALEETGYRFTGWNTAANGNGTPYAADIQVKDANVEPEDITLYAQWEEMTATLSYSSNGIGTAPDAVTMRYTTSTNAANGIVATGFTFIGWNTMQDGTGISYAPGDQVKAINVIPSNMTLYAQWDEVNATLTYDSNGHGTAPEAVTMSYMASTNAASAISATGYTFMGWNTAANGSGTPYAAGAQVKAENAVPTAITLYAQWEEITATLTYDANGHGTAPAPVTMRYTTSTEAANAIIVEGYTFISWNTEADGTGTGYLVGDEIKAENIVPVDMTLYAQWEEITAMLIYNPNGHGIAPEPEEMKYSAQTIAANALSETGYVFGGWNTEANGSGDLYAAGAEVKAANVVPEEMTLYAQWTLETYSVFFNANASGDTVTGMPTTKTKTYGIDLELPETPSRTGYIFKGWSVDSGATVASYDDTHPYTANSATTLYAVWQEKNKVKILYNANGGAQSYEDYKYVGEPYTIFDTIPTKWDGAQFLGWSLVPGDEASTHIDYVAGDIYSGDTQLNLYAAWELLYVEVTLDPNGGNLGTITSPIRTRKGQNTVLPAEEPTRVGYRFLGWATSPTATTGTYAASEEVPIGTDTTLYAIWNVGTPVNVTYYSSPYFYATKNLSQGEHTETIDVDIPKGFHAVEIGFHSNVDSHTYEYKNASGWHTIFDINSSSLGGGTTFVSNSAISQFRVTYNYSSSSTSYFYIRAQGHVYNETLGSTYTHLPTGRCDNFIGTFDDKNGNGLQIFGNTLITSTSPRTIYTVYADNDVSTYSATLTYNANGHGTAPASVSLRYLTEEFAADAITAEGYTFTGWNTKANGTGTSYSPGDMVKRSETMPEAITLYAVWERSMGQYLDGESFNTALSGLAGSASNITSISWEEGQFSENDVPADAIDVSANDAPIWAWYEGNGTIKLWSNNAENLLSDDCSKMFKDMSLTSMDVVSDLHIVSTSNVTDMSEMFSECHEIESIDFSDFDTSSVTNMAQLFNNNRKLTSLDISSFDTSNVTNMYYMFRGNDINSSIDVSNFDTSNVTNMEGMFRYCKGLTELDLSNFNTSQVTNMKDMFRFCDLEKIYVSAEDFDVSSVTSSNDMFRDCVNLRGGNGTLKGTNGPADLTNAWIDGRIDPETGEERPGYFWCHDSYTVTFDANASGDTVTNMPSSVTEVYGTKIDLTTNTTRSNNNYRFAGWSTSSGDNGTYYYGPQGYAVVRDVTLYAKWVARNDAVAQYIDGTSFNLAIKRLAGDNTTDVTSTTNKINHIEWQTSEPSQSILNNAEIVSVNEYLPIYAWYESGTKTIKLWSDCPYRIFNDDASNMLRCMTTLQSLDPLGNLGVVDTSNVVSMANMFKKDTALTTLDISGFNTENVTSMESLFAYNSSLTSINVDNIDTSKVTTMKEMFRLCGKLTTLDISSFDSSSLTIANQMFKECSRLTRIYASTAFTGDNLTNSSEMFNSCSNLVGGNGTTYNSSNITGSYAWIDGRVDPLTGNNRPGYFWCHDEYTITFNANAGSDTVTGMPSTKTKTYGEPLEIPETPTRDGYVFKGWSIDSSATVASYDATHPYDVNSEATLYAIWKIKYGQYLDGRSFNSAIVQLAGDYDNITSIAWQSDDFSVSDVPNGAINVSAKGEPIYAWYAGNGAIKLWSEAKRVFLNEDCHEMFKYFGLTSISLEDDLHVTSTSNVTNMDEMFSKMLTIITIDLGENFDTSNVTTMGAMFGGVNLQTIYSSTFDTSSLTNSNQKVFYYCPRLHGGNGTTYNESNPNDATYARIDGEGGLSGYFTQRP